MKMVGLLLIVFTGLGMGLAAAGGLRRRVSNLEQLGRLMGRMADQIRYTAAPVEELLESAERSGEFTGLPVLDRACAGIREGANIHDAWDRAVRDSGRDAGLTQGDQELLMGFGVGLGTTDVAGQVANCGQYRELLDQRLSEARKESESKGRLYLTLGFSAGMAVALLLL